MNRNRFRLHDKVIAVAAENPIIEETLVEAVLYKSAQPTDEQAADLLLAYHVVDALPNVPEGASHITTHDETIKIFHLDDEYFLSHENAFVHINPEQAVARGKFLKPMLEADMQLTRFYLVTIAVLILLRYQHRYALHAAALVNNDAGVLLVARSGSGKSTSALNLVRAGWEHLSDDTVLLRRNGSDAVEALSFRHDFCVKHSMVEQFPELGSKDWPPSLSDPEKWRVNLDELYPGQFRERCIPRVVLMPTIVDEPQSELKEVPAATVLQHLSNQGGALLTPRQKVVQEHFNVLRDLINQVDCYQLLAGRDAIDEPDATAELVSSVLPEQK